jgi:septum formation protein
MLAVSLPEGPPMLRLASASPRRSQLLGQIGVAHRVAPAEVDETRQPGEPPCRYVERLAREKAMKAYGTGTEPVLAADTTVALADELYGKPADRADAVRMLQALSGQTHTVHTAVALAHAGGLELARSDTMVSFRQLTVEECERYWDSGEPAGKAGAYAVQGYAAVFIARIEGSYSGVMGLPLYETAGLLAAAGLSTLLGSRG